MEQDELDMSVIRILYSLECLLLFKYQIQIDKHIILQDEFIRMIL